MLFGCYMADACETAAISVHVLYTPYTYAPVYSVTLFDAIYIYVGYIHVCLAASH